MAYQFKIQIKGITKPPVWRRITVPSDYTFQEFHSIIQCIFEWGDYHLYKFTDNTINGNICISEPNEDDSDLFSDDIIDASSIKISQIFNSLKKLLYIYDFGDYWIHQITLESTSDNNQNKVICLAGKGTCPPEDCGGYQRYQAIKEVLANDSNSEEAQYFRDWLCLDPDEKWDSDNFDLESTNMFLQDY